jgi:trans-aconitate methyltransferase
MAASRRRTVDYSAVLADFGGTTPKGEAAYGKQLLADIKEDLEIKNTIFSQSVIGEATFLEWITETFFSDRGPREQPAALKIKYRSKNYR